MLGSVAEVWTEERSRLMTPTRPFDGFVEHTKRVLPTCLVHLERNRCSVPPQSPTGRSACGSTRSAPAVAVPPAQKAARFPAYKDMARSDFVILDGLGDLPFSASGDALLFHPLSRLSERTSVAIATNLSVSEWAGIFGDARMTTALLGRLMDHCHILESGNGSFRFKASAQTTKRETARQ